MNLLRRYEDQFKGYTYLRLDPDPHLATTPASNGAAAPANGPPACDPPPPPTPA